MPPSACPNPVKAPQPDGRIACSDTDRITVLELVERAAPILWFSPDEQLFDGGSPGAKTPAAFPFDVLPRRSATVYFKIRKINTRLPGLNASEREDQLRLDLMSSILIDYFFYYERDFGFGGHAHDLEQLRVHLDVVPNAAQCAYAIFYRRAEGWAHGSPWYNNILEISTDGFASDYSFPLTALVEEGKHAVAPDRNGDGHYTPGYDVNRRIREAWGIRDTLRGGDMAAPRYDAETTKPREPDGRVGPLTTIVSPDCLYNAYRRRVVDGPPKHGYELRPALGPPDDPAFCAAARSAAFDLCKTMRHRELGEVALIRSRGQIN